jgi:hypothetical protein
MIHSDELDEFLEQRCANCPAFWTVQNWDDWDHGCLLGKDIERNCALALVPHSVMKLACRIKDWHGERWWRKHYDHSRHNNI